MLSIITVFLSIITVFLVINVVVLKLVEASVIMGVVVLGVFLAFGIL